MHSKNTSSILIISPEPWDGHFVSKHHYAVTLASQGYRVYFLNPPKNCLKSITIEKTEYKNLWSISAPQVAKGLRFYPTFLRSYIEKKWLYKLEDQTGRYFNTIWLFENSRFYSMRFAEERVKIYHQVDLNQNFHVKKASLEADICFCTTDTIFEKIHIYNKHVYKIHHGVHLFKDLLPLSEIQQNYFQEKNINVTYIGNLDMAYLDIGLLVNIVNHYKDIQFHFIGGYTQHTPLYLALKDKKNICWWGKVKSELIPNILKYSDVFLVSYQSQYFIDQSSPHKMMEYLADGKVIVATYTDEYKDKRELLEMVDNSEDFIDKFDEVVNHLNSYNAKEKQCTRRAFAKEHSYEKQLEKIKYYLKQYNLEL